MASKSTTKTTREDRAATLPAEGAVTLHFDGSASVRGSGRAVYTVRKDENGVPTCTCPDHTRRAIDCKHMRATRSLCRLYRACRDQAKETGRAWMPWVLDLALRGATSPAPVAVPVLTCGDCGTVIQRGRTCTDCLDASLFGTVAA